MSRYLIQEFLPRLQSAILPADMVPNSPRMIETNDDWLPCMPGTISDPNVSFSMKVADRKSHLFSLGLIYICGALVFGTVILSWVSRPMHGEALAPGHISCEQVRQHLSAYSDMDICDCQLRASISTHLMRCPKCDLIYQGLAGNHIAQPPVNTQCDYSPNQATDPPQSSQD